MTAAAAMQVTVRCEYDGGHVVMGPFPVADLTRASKAEIDPCCPECGGSTLYLCIEPVRAPRQRNVRST